MKIYHYTSLPSLVSMISNNSLKLIRLDKFLAYYEPNFFPKTLPIDHAIINDFRNVYISSWTTDAEESISAWRLFSSLDTGVRIGLDLERCFGDVHFCEVEVFPLQFPHSLIKSIFQTKIPDNKLVLSDIQYVNDSQEMVNQIFNRDYLHGDADGIIKYFEHKKSLISLSSNKKTAYNEVRLQVEVIPPAKPYSNKALRKYEAGLFSDNLISVIIAKLPECFFKDIEIIVSPCFAKENICLLNDFISAHGINTSVQLSDLHNLTTPCFP